MKKVLGLLFLVLIYFIFEVAVLYVDRIDIETSKIEKDIRILQISDYHDSKIHEKMIIKCIVKENPDIIVLTGDLIDFSTKKLDKVLSFIDEIIKLNSNVYYVPGNHEYYSGLKYNLMLELQRRGINVLLNRGKTITIGKEIINICGIDDVNTGYFNIKGALNNIDNKNYTILLSHAPDIINKEKNINADLILSGHTHGGQIRLPFIGAIVAPGQGFLPKYDKGLFNIGDKTLLYIDSGVGTSHYPIRILNRSQVSLISLKSMKKD